MYSQLRKAHNGAVEKPEDYISTVNSGDLYTEFLFRINEDMQVLYNKDQPLYWKHYFHPDNLEVMQRLETAFKAARWNCDLKNTEEETSLTIWA